MKIWNKFVAWLRSFGEDTRSADAMNTLMGNEKADLVFTDPPYNVAIDGNVCGLGSVKHREFSFASGEMSDSEFVGFLTDTLSNLARVMRDGAIAYGCSDCGRWRGPRRTFVASRCCT